MSHPISSSRRNRRILEEIAVLAKGFDTVHYDNEEFTWIHIPVYQLPRGWNQTATELLVVLPRAYPHVPPDGFHLNQRLYPLHGHLDEHYFENGLQGSYSDKGWGWYCIHSDSSRWTATADIWSGDNLVKYVELIRAILTRIAQG